MGAGDDFLACLRLFLDGVLDPSGFELSLPLDPDIATAYIRPGLTVVKNLCATIPIDGAGVLLEPLLTHIEEGPMRLTLRTLLNKASQVHSTPQGKCT